MRPSLHPVPRSRLLALALAPTLVLAACGGEQPQESGAAPEASTASPDTASDDTASDDTATEPPTETTESTESTESVSDPADAAEATTEPTQDAAAAEARPTEEARGPSPRLAYAYDGGVQVLDAETLQVVGDFATEEFTRLNPAGDDRHLLLSDSAGFRVLDAGTWSEPHGDHDHSYTTEPLLTDLTVEGSQPGHVVTHAGSTVLYFDGSGAIAAFDPAALSEGEVALTGTWQAESPHHGVAVQLEDGSLLESVGTEEARTGARVLGPDGTETARSEECPGVHGETVAADEVVVLGCEGGVLLYDGDFTPVETPQDGAQIGSVAGTEASPVVLGDYSTDPDAEPEQVALIDTVPAEMDLLDLGTSYSFRSLGRGPEGEALVLGTDGSVHVIDPEAVEVTESIPVVEPWEEPADWQEARPSLFVLGQFAYVTEPVTSELHVVDLAGRLVIDSTVLDQVPNELSGVGGGRAGAEDHAHEGHEGEDHEGHEGEDHEGEHHEGEGHEGEGHEGHEDDHGDQDEETSQG